jgi:hypothetical protein
VGIRKGDVVDTRTATGKAAKAYVDTLEYMNKERFSSGIPSLGSFKGKGIDPSTPVVFNKSKLYDMGPEKWAKEVLRRGDFDMEATLTKGHTQAPPKDPQKFMENLWRQLVSNRFGDPTQRGLKVNERMADFFVFRDSDQLVRFQQFTGHDDPMRNLSTYIQDESKFQAAFELFGADPEEAILSDISFFRSKFSDHPEALDAFNKHALIANDGAGYRAALRVFLGRGVAPATSWQRFAAKSSDRFNKLITTGALGASSTAQIPELAASTAVIKNVFGNGFYSSRMRNGVVAMARAIPEYLTGLAEIPGENNPLAKFLQKKLTHKEFLKNMGVDLQVGYESLVEGLVEGTGNTSNMLTSKFFLLNGMTGMSRASGATILDAAMRNFKIIAKSNKKIEGSLKRYFDIHNITDDDWSQFSKAVLDKDNSFSVFELPDSTSEKFSVMFHDLMKVAVTTADARTVGETMSWIAGADAAKRGSARNLTFTVLTKYLPIIKASAYNIEKAALLHPSADNVYRWRFRDGTAFKNMDVLAQTVGGAVAFGTIAGVSRDLLKSAGNEAEMDRLLEKMQEEPFEYFGKKAVDSFNVSGITNILGSMLMTLANQGERFDVLGGPFFRPIQRAVKEAKEGDTIGVPEALRPIIPTQNLPYIKTLLWDKLFDSALGYMDPTYIGRKLDRESKKMNDHISDLNDLDEL